MVDRDSESRPGSNPQSWSDWVAGAEPEAPVASGSVIRGRFVLEELIGAGGMGEVYRALDRRREEAQDRHPHVAIKILSREFRRHPDALRALQREARKAQKLAHPNICTVYDFDRDGANVYLVMELLEGRPLNELVKSHAGTGLGRERAFELIEELAIALAHAHSRGIVHADFKPSNVFVTDAGEVKVLDFGIARAARTGPGSADLTQTVFDPAKLGAATLAYASPEQLLGVAEPDPRDDVYSFAVVAYELFAGRHPFERRSALEAQLQEMQVAPLAVLDDAQNALLARALAFNRERRLASINDLVVGLGLAPVQRTLATLHAAAPAPEEATRFAATGSPAAPPPAASAAAPAATPPAPRRARLPALLAAAIGAVVLVGGTFYAVQGAREREAQQRQLEEQQRLAAEARIRQEQEARLAAERARREAEARAAAEQQARAVAEQERLEAEALAERERIARQQSERERASARRAERKQDAATVAAPPAGAPAQVDAAEPAAAPAAARSAGPPPAPARAGAKSATIYRWKDEAGQVHYGTQVPQQYADRAVAVVPDG